MGFLTKTLKKLQMDRRNRQISANARHCFRNRLRFEQLEERRLLAVVSYWTADGTGNDSVGSNHGTLMNGASYAAGQIGQAFSFDGVDDRILVADSPSLALTHSLTIEGWIKVNAFTTSQILFRGDSRGGLDPYVLNVSSGGFLGFGVSSETLGFATGISAAVPLGQFVHVAATLDDATGLMSLYENGVLMSQTTTSIRPFGALDPTQQPALGIGNANSTYNTPFNGLIDDLKLYDNALSAADVLADFNAGKGSLQSSTTISISDDNITEGNAHFNSSLGSLVSQGANGGLRRSSGMTYGPDGNLYVGSYVTDEILRYSPTGAFMGAFVSSGSGGLKRPAVDGLAFRPDGWLYVASYDNSNVLRFNAATGAYHDVFIPSGSGGLTQPQGMTFGPDGNLYISSSGTNQILRYSGSSGAYLGSFVAAGSGGLSGSRCMVFGPDSNLYVVSSNTQSVLRYSGSTGAFIDAFIPSNRGGLSGPGELLFNNGSFYVASQGTKQVLRYDAMTGAFLDAVDPANSSGLDRPIGLLLGTDGSLLVGGYNEIKRYGATTGAVFSVSLSSPWPATVTVDYTTANGSALTNSDYLSTSGTFTFLPGQMKQTIVVPILDDSIIELTKTFNVTLSNASGATISRAQGTGTIIDDDTKFYVVDDASLDKTFEYGSGTGTAGENYALNSGNTAPRGAASTAAGNKVWVVDVNRKVYVYSTTGALLGSWTAGSMSASAQPEGITTNGTDVWIVDNKTDKVFKYVGAASLLSGSQTAASSFSLNGSNTNGKGIVTDGASLWVVDDGSSSDKVYKYSVSGTAIGSWTIDTANSHPTGLTINPANVSDIWIVDNGTDTVYQYNVAATRISGSQIASATFALAAGNTNPQDIVDPPAAGIDMASKVANLDNHKTPQLSQSSNSLIASPLVEFANRASYATRIDSQDRIVMTTKDGSNQSQTQTNKAVDHRMQWESLPAITQAVKKNHDQAILDLMEESFDKGLLEHVLS